MRLLRLRQFAEGAANYRVTIELDGAGARRSAESRFAFQLTSQDREDIRWYLEDFLQYPMDPAPAIAARIERRMEEIGKELFGKVLGQTPVWHEARHDLSGTRIEIETSVQDAMALPWELLRDPDADVPLALRARAFVRATHDSAQRPAEAPQSAAGPIRVLLVICRPRGSGDVPFRSVARRIVEGLRGSDAVRLTVLRPPTFERLSRVLREAHDSGKPYHLVHFDGHGVWSENGPRQGGHGYLAFENAALEGNRQFVDGPGLGNLLAETGVATLVLNACQSAEEPNLVRALALAGQHGWRREAILAMQGLRILYYHTGRRVEWARLVEETFREFVNPATDGPLPGLEDDWSLISEYRVRIAQDARKWDEAERLQRNSVDWARRHAHEGDRNTLRTLSVALHDLGQIQRETARPACVDAYRESFDLALRIGHNSTAAVAALKLGHAYKDLSALRDLDEAERWYRKSLELTPQGDRVLRAAGFGSLGLVAGQRFEEARATQKPDIEILRHLNDAIHWHSEALEMTPPDAVGPLAVVHAALGTMYAEACKIDRALQHYREAIRLQEAQGSPYHAALIRYNVGVSLKRVGRFADARQYAKHRAPRLSDIRLRRCSHGREDPRPYLSDRQGR
jgi:tetratricopeptide (TPR) repeat protein